MTAWEVSVARMWTCLVSRICSSILNNFCICTKSRGESGACCWKQGKAINGVCVWRNGIIPQLQSEGRAAANICPGLSGWGGWGRSRGRQRPPGERPATPEHPAHRDHPPGLPVRLLAAFSRLCVAVKNGVHSPAAEKLPTSERRKTTQTCRLAPNTAERGSSGARARPLLFSPAGIIYRRRLKQRRLRPFGVRKPHNCGTQRLAAGAT